MTKLTKKEKFAMLREIVIANGGNEMLVEFIDHEVELLTKKNAGDKKPTANQVANESIKAEILADWNVESGFSSNLEWRYIFIGWAITHAI